MADRQEIEKKEMYLRSWQICRLCSVENQAPVRVQVYSWEAHMLNHRIYRALGQEEEWCIGLREKAAANYRRFVKNRPVKKRAAVVHAINEQIEASAYMKRKVRMTRRYAMRLQWVAFQLFGPLAVFSDEVPFDHEKKFESLPPRPVNVCRLISHNLVGEGHCAMMLMVAWLSKDQRDYIRTHFQLRGVARKPILYGPPQAMEFHVYDRKVVP